MNITFEVGQIWEYAPAGKCRTIELILRCVKDDLWETLVLYSDNAYMTKSLTGSTIALYPSAIINDLFFKRLA